MNTPINSTSDNATLQSLFLMHSNQKQDAKFDEALETEMQHPQLAENMCDFCDCSSCVGFISWCAMFHNAK
jgi:hypothetical protein